MGKPINENPNPAPRCSAPVVRMHPDHPDPDQRGTYISYSMHDAAMRRVEGERDAEARRASKLRKAACDAIHLLNPADGDTADCDMASQLLRIALREAK